MRLGVRNLVLFDHARGLMEMVWWTKNMVACGRVGVPIGFTSLMGSAYERIQGKGGTNSLASLASR